MLIFKQMVQLEEIMTSMFLLRNDVIWLSCQFRLRFFLFCFFGQIEDRREREREREGEGEREREGEREKKRGREREKERGRDEKYF